MAEKRVFLESEKENTCVKKRRLSMSLKKNRQFRNVSSESLQSMATVTVAKNSARASKWATTNLRAWLDDYNARNPEQKCPDEILTPECSSEVLNKWLYVYIVEIRSKDGSRYPPRTIYALLCGILREMRAANADYPNFLNKDYAYFHVSLDNLLRSLRKDGFVAASSHAEGISTDEENILWDSGVLNVDSPLGLLRAVFYYCGKCFCLRGGEEHRNLSLSQLERLHTNPTGTFIVRMHQRIGQGG